MKKLKSGQTQDRLGELPDSLILKILSCLEMRDVVRTTLLSKRWNYLWTTIPCLCFSHYVSPDNVEKIRNFINRALLLWKGTKILKFNFVLWGQVDESSFRDVNLWLRFVTEKKVEDLHLHLQRRHVMPILLPNCLYECSSIRKLSLLDRKLHIRGDVRWDQLKSLKITCYYVSEDVINRLVSGAPQLEIFELSNLYDTNENLSIRSCSLKKLSIHKSPFSKTECDPSKHAVLTIWAPNLETLILSGSPYSKCLLMDVSSLTDVTLYFEDVLDVVLGETLRQILPTFQHVEVVTLSSWCFKVLAVMKGESLFSPLSNVKLLRLSYDNLIKPNEIVGLLKIFPKLKMLDISVRRMVYSSKHPGNKLSKQDIGEPLNSEVNTIKSLMMQLRIVEIGWVKYEKSILQFIEFFLKHATVLEKIVIQKSGGKKVESDDMILAAEKLLSLQRSFPTVELIFCKERC
ncbi:hypothetical protein C2S51_026507 [Perilla frutescens var. frutescens]|nr:hypothetical protein C2S51_026507 [Perilla frutescens var. frutescens]